jgi:Double zinc ribbon
MIICPQCQSANREGSRFCNECGTRLQPAAPVPSPSTGPGHVSQSISPASAGATFQALDAAPDWLRALRGAAVDSAAESPSEVQADLLVTSESTPGTEHVASAPVGSVPVNASGSKDVAAAEIPDWLHGLRQSGLASTSLPPKPASPMAELPAASPTKALSAAPAAPIEKARVEPADVPDWLRDFRDGRAAPQPSASVQSEVPRAGAGHMPGWLSDLNTEAPSGERPPVVAAASESPSVAEAAEVQPPMGSEEIPDWLKGLSLAQEGGRIAEQTTHDVAVEELPARLQSPAAVTIPVAEAGPSAAPAPSVALAGAEAGPSTEGLIPGEIPSWVLALRPGALPSVSWDILETSGLLAGIRGALPVESIVSMPHKVASVPAANAEVPVTGFSELHAPKPTPPPLPPPSPSKRRLGCSSRIGLPLLIIFVIALAFLPLPLVSDWRGAAIAAYQPSRDFYQTINHVNGLQPDALALVAIDYSAGSRAELDPQAKAVLSHLFQNKQRIVTVSFVPEGGQLAQDLLVSANPANSQFTYPYAYGVTHINLGFQSGGEASLRKLSQNPLSVFSVDYRDGKPVDSWPLTKSWKTLDDVGLIVVFSDDGAQVVRWIEQVAARPNQSYRTLLAGVSKSSESVLLPYYESRQLKGLLAGTHGAAEYEGFLLQPGSAAATLDGISYAVIVLVLVIVLSILSTTIIRRAS